MRPIFSSTQPMPSISVRRGAVTRLIASSKNFPHSPLENAEVRRSHHAQISCTTAMMACPHHVSPYDALNSSQFETSHAMPATAKAAPYTMKRSGFAKIAAFTSDMISRNHFRTPHSFPNGLIIPSTPNFIRPDAMDASPITPANTVTASAA